MKRLAMVATLAVLSTVVQARQFEVAAWRGESVAALVEDFAVPDMDLDLLPEGVEGRMGTLREVRYMTAPRSLQYLYCADRVEWDSGESGPRVIELTVSPDAKAGVYNVGPMKLKIV